MTTTSVQKSGRVHHLPGGSPLLRGQAGWRRATKARIEPETGHTVIWPFELFD